jgi:hypothetical protein
MPARSTSEPFDWYAEVTDLETGYQFKELLETRIQPGCFQPEGEAHRCTGRQCDCLCHEPWLCRWCGGMLEDNAPPRHRSTVSDRTCKNPEFARRIEV